MKSSTVCNISVLAACRGLNTMHGFISYFDMLDYDIIGLTQYGYDCVENALSDKPDVIIADMILYDFDALELTERIRAYPELDNTVIVVITEVNDSSYINGILAAGADDIIVAPFDCVALDKRIRRALSKRQTGITNLQNDDSFVIKAHIRSMLNRLKMPQTMLGFTYTCSAIQIAIIDEDAISSITKSIYPQIAKEHKAADAAIERSIRNAIDKTWHNLDDMMKEELFGTADKPTNRQFIAKISEKVKQELKL